MEPQDSGWQDKAIDAGRVFTPTAPIDERSLFAGREEQVRLILDVINQKGQHAILYGERGVGKTSLANVLSSFLGHPGPAKKGLDSAILAPRVNCDTTDSFESVWRKVFELLTLTGTVPALGFGRSPHEQTTSAAELLGNDVNPESVRRALTILSSSSVPIIIIDEFDRLTKEPRSAFADTVKTLSDHAIRATIVLVGVADSVDQLIQEHQSVERALVQIRMPRMSQAEIIEIIGRGLGRLGMTIDATATRRISRLSQGLPHYAHLLALHACRAALDGRTLRVTVGSVEKAIEKAIGGAQQSIQSHYEFAVRSSRKDNLFADVLLGCALASTDELGFFAAQDVREPFRKITGKKYEIPSYQKHLNEFCDAKRGPVLQKTGSKRKYRYRFSNPLLQPYVIMQGLRSGRIEGAMLDSPED